MLLFKRGQIESWRGGWSTKNEPPDLTEKKKNNGNNKLIFTELLRSGGNVKLWGVSLHCSGGQQTECDRTLKEMGFNNRKS